MPPALWVFMFLAVLTFLAWLYNTIWGMRPFYIPDNECYTTNTKVTRLWASVELEPHEYVIKVKRIVSDRDKLVRDLCIVAKHDKSEYDGMSYDQVLATVTSEEANNLTEIKEFLNG